MVWQDRRMKPDGCGRDETPGERKKKKRGGGGGGREREREPHVMPWSSSSSRTYLTPRATHLHAPARSIHSFVQEVTHNAEGRRRGRREDGWGGKDGRREGRDDKALEGSSLGAEIPAFVINLPARTDRRA